MSPAVDQKILEGFAGNMLVARFILKIAHHDHTLSHKTLFDLQH